MKPIRRTSRRKKQISIPKKEPCHCGSGKPYLYCHFGVDHETTLHTGINCKVCGTEITKDISSDLLVRISNGMLKWHNYFKANDLFKFNFITIGQMVELEKLESERKSITKIDLYKVYLDSLTKEKALAYIASSYKYPEFSMRIKIIEEAVMAHFEGKYTLSIPVLFLLIEGIIREIQNIPSNKPFQCKFEKEEFSETGLFMIADDLEYFNTFINKLYEGNSGPEKFNRNSILHGTSIDYFSEEHSITLILSLLEIIAIQRRKREKMQNILDLF